MEKTIEIKVQAALTEEVGSFERDTIATDATIDIMKNDEYVQMLEAKLLTNEHDLSSLNKSITGCVQIKAENALESICASLPQGQTEIEATVTHADTCLIANITALCEELNTRINDLNRIFQLATLETHRET